MDDSYILFQYNKIEATHCSWNRFQYLNQIQIFLWISWVGPKLCFMSSTVWPEKIWIKVKKSWLLLPQHQSSYPRGPESASIEIPPFQTQICLLKEPINVNMVKQDLLHKNSFWKFYEVRSGRGDFKWYRFWASCVCYFDAVAVKVKSFLLLFSLALAILHIAAFSTISVWLSKDINSETGFQYQFLKLK